MYRPSSNSSLPVIEYVTKCAGEFETKKMYVR